MAKKPTKKEPSSTVENRTAICYSCSVRLSGRLHKLEHSVKKSILEAVGSPYPMVKRVTDPLYCDICSKVRTKITISTQDYYTLRTLLGTRWQSLNSD